jgi:hypothetical protein
MIWRKSKWMYRSIDRQKKYHNAPVHRCIVPALPIGNICNRNNMNYHCYAYDIQIYIMTEPWDINWNDISIWLSTCLTDIQNWMSANLLKLNQEKTELIIFAPKTRLSEIEGFTFSLAFLANIIHNTPFVKNLGTYFNTSLTMEKHCNTLKVSTKSCYFHLRNIRRITNITEDACKTLVISLVTSRFGLWKCFAHRN